MLRWLAVALAAAAAVAGGVLWRRPDKAMEPAAFLLPVDQSSRATLGGFRSTRLTTTHPVSPEQTVYIPDGSRVRVIHPDGRLEEVAGPRDLTFPEEPTSRDLDHFRSPLSRLASDIRVSESRAAPPVRITSPADLTTYLNPTVTWDATETALYDVALIDPADPLIPPRVAEKVRPPVKFTDLQTPQNKQLPPDRIHQVLIFEHGTGVPLGTMQFLTSAAATVADPPLEPAALLAEATRALAKRPFRTGDAWVALQRLPAEWATSELALRLKLRAAAELGLERELQRAKLAVGK